MSRDVDWTGRGSERRRVSPLPARIRHSLLAALVGTGGLAGCGEVNDNPASADGRAGAGGTNSGHSGGTGGEHATGGGLAGTGGDTCAELTDPGLLVALRERLPANDPITARSVLNIQALSATAVESLEGLDCLPHLTSLNVEESPLLTDLTPLVKVAHLEFLQLHQVPVNGYSAISKLKKLMLLTLVDAPVDDLAPLPALPLLEHLTINGGSLSDLSPIASSTSLTQLAFTRTAITSLAPLLSGTISPGTLYVQENPLTELALDEQIPALAAKGWCIVSGTLEKPEEHPLGCVPPSKP